MQDLYNAAEDLAVDVGTAEPPGEGFDECHRLAYWDYPMATGLRYDPFMVSISLLTIVHHLV